MAWYITLPSIRPTIAIMLILAVGGIMGSNMELILLLYSSATYETADVIGTYIYRIGIEGGQFSFTAAIGLFATVINFVLVFGANRLSGKLTGTSLF
jgi:putative aldouronate transport system permease protein